MIESELILSCDKKFVNFATFQILILQPNKNATNRNFGKKTRLTGCKTLFLQHRQNRSGKAMIPYLDLCLSRTEMNTGDGQLERIGGSPQISLKKDDPIEHGIVSPNPVEKK